MTMSLSVERPIVYEPLGFCIDPDRDGNSAWNILVARFDTSGDLASTGDIWVCGAAYLDRHPGRVRLEIRRRAGRVGGRPAALRSRVHRLPGWPRRLTGRPRRRCVPGRRSRLAARVARVGPTGMG